MQSFTDRGIVLNVSACRDSDLIAEVLTSQHGKVSALAKSARASRKRFMGGIDVFDCATYEFAPLRNSSGNNDRLYLLESSHEKEVWLGLRSRLLSFSLGALALESTRLLTPERDPEGHPLFPLLHSGLMFLNSSEEVELSVSGFVFFLLNLLSECGLSPLESRDISDRAVLQWWNKLLGERSICSPELPALPRRSLEILIQHIQISTGRPLRSAEGLMSLFQKQSLVVNF